MKKLMTLMLGLSFLVGSVAIAADTAKDTAKKSSAKKTTVKKDTAKKDTAK
jgi:ABC-type nickel/cobalt efflux system permease component RcnA